MLRGQQILRVLAAGRAGRIMLQPTVLGEPAQETEASEIQLPRLVGKHLHFRVIATTDGSHGASPPSSLGIRLSTRSRTEFRLGCVGGSATASPAADGRA